MNPSPWALPDLNDESQLDLLDLTMMDAEYTKFRALAVQAVAWKGIETAFEKLPELETVYFDFTKGNFRVNIRSNPSEEEYGVHIVNRGVKNAQRTLDLAFDKAMSGVRKRCGQTVDTAGRLGTVFHGVMCQVERAHHKVVFDCLREHPKEGWNEALIAKAVAATLEKETAAAPKQSKPSMRV
jgi:hypothetical protein